MSQFFYYNVTLFLFGEFNLNTIRLHYFSKRLGKSRMVTGNYQVTCLENGCLLGFTEQSQYFSCNFHRQLSPWSTSLFRIGCYLVKDLTASWYAAVQKWQYGFCITVLSPCYAEILPRGFGIGEEQLTVMTRDHNYSALQEYGGACIIHLWKKLSL